MPFRVGERAPDTSQKLPRAPVLCPVKFSAQLSEPHGRHAPMDPVSAPGMLTKRPISKKCGRTWVRMMTNENDTDPLTSPPREETDPNYPGRTGERVSY